MHAALLSHNAYYLWAITALHCMLCMWQYFPTLHTMYVAVLPHIEYVAMLHIVYVATDDHTTSESTNQSVSLIIR